MIDDKKIEEAAIANSAETFVHPVAVILDTKGLKMVLSGLINEFLKDLWHPTSEEPKKRCVFLYKTIFKGYGVNQIINGNEWKYIIKYQKATQWLYVDDLFPKEVSNEKE